METVNCHRIIRKDQIATNGVVHVIDGVLDLALAQNSDIIELASRDGRFRIFTKALENSELGNRIRLSEIPCTIFAPTDQAFHHIPKAQLTDMLENPVALNGNGIISNVFIYVFSSVLYIILFSINCSSYRDASRMHAKYNFGISRKYDATTRVKIKLRPIRARCRQHKHKE